MVLPHFLKYWCNHPKKLRIALQQRLYKLFKFTESYKELFMLTPYHIILFAILLVVSSASIFQMSTAEQS